MSFATTSAGGPGHSRPSPSAGPGEEATTAPMTQVTAADIATIAPARSFVGIAGGDRPPSSPPKSNPPGQPETARIEPPTAAEPTGPAPRPVTAETLADASPPKAAQANVDLPTATVGSSYRAELPTFADPGGKGLRLTASGLPDGLTFSDAGGGKGAIEGVPQQPTSASIRIVATNLHDRTAQMTATLVVARQAARCQNLSRSSRPPIPAPLAETISRAGLASTGSASRSRPLQVFSPPPSPPTVQAAAPVSVDQNAAPAAPPAAATPQTVAREETRPSQPTSLAPSEQVPPPVAPASAEEKAKAFIARFDGGECFLIEPLPGSTKPHEYQAVGRSHRTVPPLRFRLQARGRRRGKPEGGADHRRAVSRSRSRPPCRAGRAAASPIGVEELRGGTGTASARDGLQSRRTSPLSCARRQRRLGAQAGSEGRRQRRFRHLQRAPDGRREFRWTDADAARDRLRQAGSRSRHAPLGKSETHRITVG